MNYEDFIKLVRKRRTIRAYKSNPVDDKIINQIIEAGNGRQAEIIRSLLK